MPAAQPSKLLQSSLWTTQVLMFLAFIIFGCMKMFMPIDHLAAMWKWPGDVPAPFLRLMGLIDVLGGVGILLPGLTRIKPQLGVLAALGCVLLQLSAIIFHTVRRETAVLWLNFILLALVSFVLWGRATKARIGQAV